METDKAYYSRRAAEERVAAFKAPDRRAHQAHLELATRYDDFITAITQRGGYLGLDYPKSVTAG
jgi:hypothetical protein